MGGRDSDVVLWDREADEERLAKMERMMTVGREDGDIYSSPEVGS
jgi:hypothetical protein